MNKSLGRGRRLFRAGSYGMEDRCLDMEGRVLKEVSILVGLKKLRLGVVHYESSVSTIPILRSFDVIPVA